MHPRNDDFYLKAIYLKANIPMVYEDGKSVSTSGHRVLKGSYADKLGPRPQP